MTQVPYSQHIKWGGLEPYISIKAWMAGLSCRVDPTWETAHVFGRGDHVLTNRAFREDLYYYNKLLIAHSLFTPEQAEVLSNHLKPTRNVNIAKTLIKRYWDAVMAEKQFNDANKIHGIEIFVDKFGYELDWIK